ncbi:Uncharacterised protein [Streptococcus pneumoniae]|nr:Uncharacterised protein [Streptococcus pneumoniae]
MSLIAMVQASGRAHLFTIFIKSSPCFIRCKKEFNSNSFFAIMRGEKSDRRSTCQNHYFYNQLCKKKSGVEPSYVMSLATISQVKKSENIGPSQPIQMESLKLPMVVTREQILLLCMRNTVNYLAIVQNLYFHF